MVKINLLSRGFLIFILSLFIFRSSQGVTSDAMRISVIDKTSDRNGTHL